ncbi:MAG: enoyl-CoA hydratase-related protein [Gammaproteobacteria bacterium]|jgi:isohexenylglutaconyl-CoA hydratase
MTQLPESKTLDLDLAGGWLTIWLDRPEARNALSAEMIGDLTGVLEAVRDDRAVRGITIRGRGETFCAGGDIKGFRAVFQGGDQSEADVAAASRRGGRLFGLIDSAPQVVVMLVEGAAVAGGLGMVCAGDLVVVTREARFALTEVRLGIPPAQIAPYVVRRIGLAAARRIMLTASEFDGAGARDLGIADFLANDADELETIEAVIRADVLRCAPGAIAATKELARAAMHLDAEAMTDLAARRFAACMLGEEGREGIAAFIEKRKPAWTP